MLTFVVQALSKKGATDLELTLEGGLIRTNPNEHWSITISKINQDP